MIGMRLVVLCMVFLFPACMGFAPSLLPTRLVFGSSSALPVYAPRADLWKLAIGRQISRSHTARPKKFGALYQVKMSSCSVCVVGSINYDQIAYVQSPPEPGQTIYGTKYSTGFGGKGANQCVMAAKLGAKTAMVGAVGNDSIAQLTRENMERLGVDISGIAEKKCVSSVAQITVSEDGQNSIIICPGANLELIPYDLDPNMESIKNCKVLLLQNEIAPRVTLAAMYRAKKDADSPPLVILNAAPAPEIGTKWEQGQWYNMEQMVAACDILCVNESEAAKIAGLSLRGDKEGWEDRLRACASKLLSMGAGKVLFTLGGEGSCLASASSGGEVDAASLVLCRVQAAQDDVEVVDTSGAGDAFLGAFAAYVAAGKTLEEALPLAGEVATLTVQAEGTQTSYPARSSLPEHLRP